MYSLSSFLIPTDTQVTYRSLSRAQNVHVNTAKEYVGYYEQVKGSRDLAYAYVNTLKTESYMNFIRDKMRRSQALFMQPTLSPVYGSQLYQTRLKFLLAWTRIAEGFRVHHSQSVRCLMHRMGEQSRHLSS